MKLTDIERGDAQPFDYTLSEPTTRIQAMGTQTGKQHPNVKASDEERSKRLDIAHAALERMGSSRAIAYELGVNSGSVSAWMHDRSPVPERYVDQLRVLAYGGCGDD